MEPEKRKELWAIVQAFGAIYCCIIGTWAVIHPPGQIPTHGGAPMSPQLLWWQAVLIVGFAICAIGFGFASILNYRILHKQAFSDVQAIPRTKQPTLPNKEVSSAPPPAGSPELPGKLTCRVMDAVAGTSPFGSIDPVARMRAMFSYEIQIAIRLRLLNQTGPPITFLPGQWQIELREIESGKRIGGGYGQTIRDDLVFDRLTPPATKPERFDKDLTVYLSRNPMDAGVPVEGWVWFWISGLMLYHAFGAKITVTAKDDDDSEWKFMDDWLPGKRLIPVQFSFETPASGAQK